MIFGRETIRENEMMDTKHRRTAMGSELRGFIGAILAVLALGAILGAAPVLAQPTPPAPDAAPAAAPPPAAGAAVAPPPVAPEAAPTTGGEATAAPPAEESNSPP